MNECSMSAKHIEHFFFNETVWPHILNYSGWIYRFNKFKCNVKYGYSGISYNNNIL